MRSDNPCHLSAEDRQENCGHEEKLFQADARERAEADIHFGCFEQVAAALIVLKEFNDEENLFQADAQERADA